MNQPSVSVRARPRIASRMLEAPTSATVSVADLAKTLRRQGVDIIDFSAGRASESTPWSPSPRGVRRTKPEEEGKGRRRRHPTGMGEGCAAGRGARSAFPVDGFQKGCPAGRIVIEPIATLRGCVIA